MKLVVIENLLIYENDIIMNYHYIVDKKKLNNFFDKLKKFSKEKEIEIKNIEDDGTNPIMHIINNRKSSKNLSYRFRDGSYYIEYLKPFFEDGKIVKLYNIYADVEELSGIEIALESSVASSNFILKKLKDYSKQYLNYKRNTNTNIISLVDLMKGNYILNSSERKMSIEEFQNIIDEYTSCFELDYVSEYDKPINDNVKNLANDNLEALEYLNNNELFCNFIHHNKIKSK